MYARLVLELLSQEPGIQVVRVVLRTPWTLNRVRGELRRDGPRLLRKAHRKLVLGDAAYSQSEVTETIVNLADSVGLQGGSLVDLARLRGVKCTTVKDHNDDQSLVELRSDNPDVIAFTGGGLIRKPLLSIPRTGILNCHMGLLPVYRGMDVVEWPFVEANDLTAVPVGITVHFMDSGLDTGPILFRRQIEYRDVLTFRGLRDRFEPHMVRSMVEAICRIRDGKYELEHQRPMDGRQYFVMHPRILTFAEHRLRQASLQKKQIT